VLLLEKELRARTSASIRSRPKPAAGSKGHKPRHLRVPRSDRACRSGNKLVFGAAAKLERRVAIIERKDMIGGVCLNTGTIPSKTLREAILYLTGVDQREIYGQSYRVKDDITIADLAARTTHVVGREMDVVRSQLSRNRVTVLTGTGGFVDPHTIEVDAGDGRAAWPARTRS